MLRQLAKWHPQARLAAMFVGVFILMQCCYAAVVLTLPTSLNTWAATAVLVFLPMWVLLAGISVFYLFFNAFGLQRRYWRRYKYAHPRNLIVAWVAPFVMMALIAMVTSTPLISELAELRRDRDFNRSRASMVILCDRILSEGPTSSSIQSLADVGVFSRVRISLRNNGSQVWFDVGDNSGEVGYICVRDGAAPPTSDDTYEIEQKDVRFYFFLERDEARRERQNGDD